MDDPVTTGSILIGLAAIIVLVLANAFFVGAEFSLVGARRTRLEALARTGYTGADSALRALKHLDRYISATQLGITLASLGLGWIGEPALAGLIDRGFTWLPDPLDSIATHFVASAIAFTIITVLHIILGELVPKALALLYPEKLSAWLIVPLRGFSWIMAGPIYVLNGTANSLLRAVGVKQPGEHERVHSPEEIRMLVEQSEESGRLGSPDARLLEGVFEFTEKLAEDVMTPRTSMSVLAGNLTIAEAADQVAEARRSRYPVHTETIDEITGVVHAKDILTTLRTDPGARISTIARPPLFVPGTREVEDVLTDMKRLKTHLAIVLDEYGGTAGLVTMEDLLEEIVGDIFDEYDSPAPEPEPSPEGSAAEIDASIAITDFNSKFGTALDDTSYTTLGGYLFGSLGRLPRVGDRIKTDEKAFEILEMDGRRVKRVKMG